MTIDIENKIPKKRGRKPKPKPIDENVSDIKNNNEKQYKKRGRKPKGGKIIETNKITQVVLSPKQENIILHLRCNTTDIKNNCIYDYKPSIEVIKPFNFNENKTNILGYDNINEYTKPNKYTDTDTDTATATNTQIVVESDSDADTDSDTDTHADSCADTDTNHAVVAGTTNVQNFFNIVSSVIYP